MSRGRARRPVSMADVARLAGVSITTVSHVINNTRPVGKVSQRSVLAAVVETGYVPDNVVRSLRTAGSRVIGVAMSVMSNPQFGVVLQGIDSAAAAAGYSLLLTETHDTPAGELRAVGEMLSRDVEAIILAPTAEASGAVEYARRRIVPVVLVDRIMTGIDIDQVGCESVEPTASLVDHLASIGHDRIAFVSGNPVTTTTSDRIMGYHRGLERNAIPFNPQYLINGESHEDAAVVAVQALLTLPSPPTAIVSGNNEMTIGVMRGIHALGLRVPSDLALVSFDDFTWSDLFSPRLTAISQPTFMIGEQAFSLVQSRLTNPGSPYRSIAITPRFMHRDSCGCRPDDDHLIPNDHAGLVSSVGTFTGGRLATSATVGNRVGVNPSTRPSPR